MTTTTTTKANTMMKFLQSGSTAEDLDKTVMESVTVSMGGAGGLAEDDWVDSSGAERPFRSLDSVSYATLLSFINGRSESIRDSRSFVHYMQPWYDWALRRAETAFLHSLKSSSAAAEFAAMADHDHEIVEILRNAALARAGISASE